MTSTGRYDATHSVIRADGTEVRPGDVVRNFRGVDATFRLLTRVPGDGTATNGKIIVDEPDWPGCERYPSVYDLTVVERADDDDPDDHEFGCTCIFCTPGA